MLVMAAGYCVVGYVRASHLALATGLGGIMCKRGFGTICYTVTDK